MFRSYSFSVSLLTHRYGFGINSFQFPPAWHSAGIRKLKARLAKVKLDLSLTQGERQGRSKVDVSAGYFRNNFVVKKELVLRETSRTWASKRKLI